MRKSIQSQIKLQAIKFNITVTQECRKRIMGRWSREGFLEEVEFELAHSRFGLASTRKVRSTLHRELREGNQMCTSMRSSWRWQGLVGGPVWLKNNLPTKDNSALVLLTDLPQICIQIDEVIMYVSLACCKFPSLCLLGIFLSWTPLEIKGNNTLCRGKRIWSLCIPAVVQHGLMTKGTGSYF